MERILHTSKRLEIKLILIPVFGLAIAYEHEHREAAIVLGCFLITLEIKRSRYKKRK